MNYRLVTSAAALAALGLLSGCTNVSAMDCDDIAEQAQRISQEQQLKITEIGNAQETSRTEREARCTARATFSDNQQRDLELKAFYEGDNTMVSYSETGGNSSSGSDRSSGSEEQSGGSSGSEGEAGSEEASENRE